MADDAPPAKRVCCAPETKALQSMTEDLRCSISGVLLVDPVAAADGQIYEREGITRWLTTNDTSPNTGAVLPNKTLTAVPIVRAMAEKLVQSGTLPDDEVREWLLVSVVRSLLADRAYCLEFGPWVNSRHCEKAKRLFAEGPEPDMHDIASSFNHLLPTFQTKAQKSSHFSAEESL